MGLLAGLLGAAPAAAQSIVDARRIEFTPSPNHNATDASGAALVQGYTLEVFVAGTAIPVSFAELGKPAPASDGKIRLDFVALLSSPLSLGVTYEALLEAFGPGGRSDASRTNTFSFGVVACTPVVSTPTQSFAAAGGTGTSTVTTAAGCVWNATSSVPWIAISSGASGSGPGAASFTVAANTSFASRSGTITLAGTTFTITQAAAVCSYAISPTAQSFTAAGGAGGSSVATTSGCAWNAVSTASWITVTSGASGSGPGGVAFSVAANTATTSRTGTLTIAGSTFTVTQANASCSYSISSASQAFAAAGGSSSTTVSAGAGCAWSTTSNASWITVTSGASASGPGSAGFSVAANTQTASRTGTLTIAGATFTVTQSGAACSYAAVPSSHTFASAGGAGDTVVTAGAGCAWTASSNASWITIVAGATGSGSGSVGFVVAAHTGTATRTGTLTVAGRTITVTQTAPVACTYSIVPTTRWFTADGGAGNSSVATAPACAWDAASNVAWVAVINAGPGNGNGKATFIVATNSATASRSGTLTIAGKTFTVTQAGTGCTYSVSPGSQAFDAAGGAGSTTLTATAGCTWEASSNDSWITITGGVSGSGTGGVTFSVASNTGSATRTGTLNIGGRTFTVTQAAPSSCAPSMSPTSRSFTSNGGSGTSTVTASSTCAWTAESNTAWIALINAGPGAGTGTVTFIVATNSSGASRTGSLTIAGRVFTVTQTATASCTYSVAPASLTLRASATTSTVAVTTQAGCAWTASGAPQWLTLTGGGPGQGSATVAATMNTGKTPRSATLTIAGQSITVTQKNHLSAPANVRVLK